MGMGGHNRIQPRDAEPIQKAFDSCCIYCFSRIDEHGLSTGGAQQDTVPLPNVKHIDLKRVRGRHRGSGNAGKRMDFVENRLRVGKVNCEEQQKQHDAECAENAPFTLEKRGKYSSALTLFGFLGPHGHPPNCTQAEGLLSVSISIMQKALFGKRCRM